MRIATTQAGDQGQFAAFYFGTVDYGETVLDEVEMIWEPDEFHTLHMDCAGETVTASCDGRVVLTAGDTRLGRGGAGYLVENGLVGFRDTRVD